MNTTGTIMAVVVFVAYIGFEGWAAHKVRYRIEPLYIHDRWVEAQHALGRCAEPEPGQLEKFWRNFVSVTRNASEDLAERNPEQSADDITESLQLRAAEREQAVDAVIDAKGCANAQVKVWLRRFEIYARLNLG